MNSYTYLYKCGSSFSSETDNFHMYSYGLTALVYMRLNSTTIDCEFHHPTKKNFPKQPSRDTNGWFAYIHTRILRLCSPYSTPFLSAASLQFATFTRRPWIGACQDADIRRVAVCFRLTLNCLLFSLLANSVRAGRN